MKTFELRLLLKLKECYHLYIPFICIGFWALLYLRQVNFILNQYWDLYIFYDSGKQVFINPEDLYEIGNFHYMPSSAVFFAFTISLFPLFIAHYIFYILNYVMALISIKEYNKILELLNVKEKIHRFLFLIIISNGFFVYRQFYYNQTKFLVLAILLFITRREIQFKLEILK